MESVCVHCGRRIVLVNYALGELWTHQPAGAAFQDRTHTRSATCLWQTPEEQKEADHA